MNHVALPLLFSIVALASAAPASGPVCPMKEGTWALIPELSDEFSGDMLDMTKWRDRRECWPGKGPGLFLPSNVRVADGLLQLTARNESVPNPPKGFGNLTTAQVPGRTAVRYGYFEVRAKAGSSQASSAFWFSNEDTPWILAKPAGMSDAEWEKNKWFEEIDVFEIAGRGGPCDNIDYMTLHTRQPGMGKLESTSANFRPKWRFEDDYHVFGLEWTKDRVRWYVDGELKSEKPNRHHRKPEVMLFDSCIMEGWFGRPNPKTLPAVFRVDYVRSWRRTDAKPGEETLLVREPAEVAPAR